MSFFNSLKNERVHGTRYSTQAEARADSFDYIDPFYTLKAGSTLNIEQQKQHDADQLERETEGSSPLDSD